VLAFLAAHVVSLILDPYAGVGIAGAFIPTLSSYRSSPVALGTLAMYALILTGITARYTKLLPPGFWLKIHRLGIGVFVLAWLHGILSGTDTPALRGMYIASGLAALLAAAYRYWVGRKARPTFSTSLPDRSGATRRAPAVGQNGSPATVAAIVPDGTGAVAALELPGTEVAS